MHALHEYLCRQAEALLRRRSVVVFYDPRREFAPFFAELSATGTAAGKLRRVPIGALTVTLAEYTGSFFELRADVEELAGRDRPDPLVLYVPGVTRDPVNSVLMELEQAGQHREWSLKSLARNLLRKTFSDGLLRKTFSDGRIDELLGPGTATYQDVVSFLQQAEEVETPSALRGLFGNQRSEPLIAGWLASTEADNDITAKNVRSELFKLIESRIGLVLPADTSLAAARERVARYVLLGDFRVALTGEPPQSIARLPAAQTEQQRERVAEITRLLRRDEPDQYAALAGRVEHDMHLRDEAIAPAQLGSVATFAFEERRLLGHIGELIAEKAYGEALDVILARRRSFWVDRDVARQAQWEASRLMVTLGVAILEARAALPKTGSDPAAWVKAYTADGGWHEIDRLHRSLETWVGKMDEEPEHAQAFAVIRREHEELLKLMANGFGKAFQSAGWAVAGILHQTSIYPQVVEPSPGPVAYFFVDAMRFEMGAELAQRLQGASELSLRPAIAALPSITPVGMAALLPGASASFSVVAERRRLASRIDGTTMPSIIERTRYLKARVPGLRDLTLDDVLRRSVAELRRSVKSAPLVIVRSGEIDQLGENVQDLAARAAMERVIGNIARAVRKLADAGIEHFVITADHGHQFSIRKDEDMRTDSPGGDTIDIHRRCWIGRGGATPPGTVRVTGAELGYDTDLEFLFPTGIGVFKAGGDLSFHHGGFSLQELVIPVVIVRMKSAQRPDAGRVVQLVHVPSEITNLIFTIRLVTAGGLFAPGPIALRVTLIAGDEEVGKAGMAVAGTLDKESGVLQVESGTEASVGMMLMPGDMKSVRVVVQDPATNAVLTQSDEIPLKLGI